MIEVPIVAEGALDAASLTQFTPITDFFALGEELWDSADPSARLAEISKLIQQG